MSFCLYPNFSPKDSVKYFILNSFLYSKIILQIESILLFSSSYFFFKIEYSFVVIEELYKLISFLKELFNNSTISLGKFPPWKKSKNKKYLNK